MSPWPWPVDVALVDLAPSSVRNVSGLGTLTRYRALTSDGIEREVIHGQVLASRQPSTRSVNLTMGTAPPLSLGPEGMIMHFLLKSMEPGIDGLIFGPERSRRDLHMTATGRREVAAQMTFARTAEAHHQIADELGVRTGVELSHMTWAGISLGAMKGIVFAARAAHRKRTLVYGHLVVPVCPNPMPRPSDAALRRFLVGELGAIYRAGQELMLRDLRQRTIGIHADVARLVRPGLVPRYLRSAPRDSVFRLFTEAWRDQVVSGDAGVAASLLPTKSLTTFELFDRDAGSPPEQWRRRLRAQLAAGTAHIVVKSGKHTDAMRLSHQRDRAQVLRRLIADVQSGVPVDELVHPLAA